MTQTLIDFSTGIVDGTASGSSGDNSLQIGDFIFTITAQGNWTASFDNGRFNFAEDASVGGENFSISVTTASGATLDFYDYQVSIHATPTAVGIWPSSVAVSNTTWSDDSLDGGPAYYRAVFGGNVPAVNDVASLTIADFDISGTDYSGTTTMWLDNITFDTMAPVTHAPTLAMTGSTPTFTENGAAVDLFSGVSAATNDSGQTFSGLKLQVVNASGTADDYINVSGTAVSLANGTSGTIAGVGSYSVSVSGTTTTLTLSSMTLSDSAMSSLIDGLSYGVNGDNPTTSTRTVSISQLTDSGSTNSTTSSVITAAVHVDAVNDAPTGAATAHLANGTEDTAYLVSVSDLLAGFSDPEGATLSISSLFALHATVSYTVGDLYLTITPEANFNGLMPLFYVVTDNMGGTTDASLSLTFDAVNDVPTGAATATLAHGTEDIAYVVNAADLLTGFSDVDGDTLTVADLSASAGASVTDNHDGTYTITPVADFNGAVALTYTVTDGHSTPIAATQSVTFDAANDAPTGAATATLAHGIEDTAYIVSAANLLAGFSDIDGDTLSVSGLSANNGASVTDNHDGTYTITPVANFNGALTLAYSVIDGNGGSKAASQSVTFDAVNDVPTGAATAHLANGTEDTAYVVSAADLLTGFSDADGDTLTVADLSASAGATVTDNHDGTYTITPVADFNGAVALTYTVTDGHSTPIAATQSVTFDAANDAPTGTATAHLANGIEDTAYIVSAANLLAGFSDIDGDTLSVSGLSASAGASVTDNHDGTYTITPVANFNGALTLAYSVIDGNGGSKAASQSVTIDAVNDVPTGAATAHLANGTEDTAYVVSAADLLTGFSDVDGDTLTVAGLSASAGATVTDNHDGTYTITPVADFNGAVALTYTVTDGHSTPIAATQSVTFDAVNDAPVATNDTGAMLEGTPTAFDVLGNDSDVDSLALSAINPVVTSNNGTVSVDGDGHLLVTYTGPSLNAGDKAQVLVSYEASDGSASDGATLTVTVTGVYDPGDEIAGTNKGDTIVGTMEGESINGYGGNDTINGRGGDDDISGGKGDDIVMGGAGNDNLHTGAGNDRINGGAGNDRLAGWAGDDVLTGGTGKDTFVFHRFEGNDIITDFVATGADHDFIDLSDFASFEAFKDVKAVMSQHNSDTIIDLPGDNSITLKHVDMDTLTRQDFIF